MQKAAWKSSVLALSLIPIVLFLILWLLPPTTTTCRGFGYESAFPCGVILLNSVIGVALVGYGVLYYFGFKPDTQPWKTLEKPVSPDPNGDMRPFPAPVFLLLFSIISFTLLIVATTGLSIQYQVYGLVFDGVGAVLVVIELSDSLFGTQDTHEVPWAFWGLVFLIVGFSLQIFALLPWSQMRNLLF